MQNPPLYLSFLAGGSVNSALMAIVAIFSRFHLGESDRLREQVCGMVVKLVLRITKL